MDLLDDLKNKINRNLFEFSRHALDQSLRRRIRLEEVREAIATSEVIEDYPDDKYGSSCLLLGTTLVGRALHLQCSYPTRPLVKFITLYEPDPLLWENLRVRKNADADPNP